MIDGLWAVEFFGSTGNAGSGIAVLINGKIYGGDSFYYYRGNYMLSGKNFAASVEVIHYAGPKANIFGPIDRLALQLSGTADENWILCTGFDPQLALRTISMRLKRIEGL